MPEIKVIYLNMKGIADIDKLTYLQNDINLMSADVICIANTNTSSADHISVNLKDFDIISRMDNLYEEKSMGMIIYKKQHIKLLSWETYPSTYYQSVICQFNVGYVCFSYMEEDSRLNDHSMNGNLLSIIGGVNIQSPEMKDSSVKFLYTVNMIGVKSARQK